MASICLAADCAAASVDPPPAWLTTGAMVAALPRSSISSKNSCLNDSSVLRTRGATAGGAVAISSAGGGGGGGSVFPGFTAGGSVGCETMSFVSTLSLKVTSLFFFSGLSECSSDRIELPRLLGRGSTIRKVNDGSISASLEPAGGVCFPGPFKRIEARDDEDRSRPCVMRMEKSGVLSNPWGESPLKPAVTIACPVPCCPYIPWNPMAIGGAGIRIGDREPDGAGGPCLEPPGPYKY